jgi:hypothetical protein
MTTEIVLTVFFTGRLRPPVRQYVCRIFRKIGVGVPYKHLSSKREFRADRLSNSHTLIITVSEIISVLARVFDLLR